jgi:hypothetical protein
MPKPAPPRPCDEPASSSCGCACCVPFWVVSGARFRSQSRLFDPSGKCGNAFLPRKKDTIQVAMVQDALFQPHPRRRPGLGPLVKHYSTSPVSVRSVCAPFNLRSTQSPWAARCEALFGRGKPGRCTLTVVWPSSRTTGVMVVARGATLRSAINSVVESRVPQRRNAHVERRERRWRCRSRSKGFGGIIVSAPLWRGISWKCCAGLFFRGLDLHAQDSF